MPGGFYFGGRRYVTPTVVSAIDDSAMADTSTANVFNLAILGEADHGVPNQPYVFGSASDAAAVLVSGTALDAITQAFDPSAETGGPATITFMRVGQPTQSTAVLTDVANNPVFNLATTDYGVQSSGVLVNVQAGTNQGLKISVNYAGKSYVGDDLYSAPINVAYNGGGSTPVAQVTAIAIILTVSGSVVATFPFASFPSVGSMLDAMNSVSGFSATSPLGQSDVATAQLFDTVANTPVSTSGTDLTAINSAVLAWFNGPNEGLINATWNYGVGPLVPTTGTVRLTGGTSPATLVSDWSTAFDLLQAEDVQWVVPLSSNPAIIAMASAHVDFMSTIGLSERRAIVGMGLGTTDAQALAEVPTLNDDRVSLVHLGMYNFNSAGALTLYPPYVLAAKIAGGFAGSAPGTAMTNKSLKVQGFERKLRVPIDTDPLIDGGVLTVYKTRKGYVVGRSISTWLVDDNYNRVEVSTGVALDYTVQALRAALEFELGKTGNAQNLGLAVSVGETVLTNLSKPAPAGPGLLVGDAKNPPFKNLVASLSGDSVLFECQVSPGIPINFVGITVHAVPYSGTATA